MDSKFEISQLEPMQPTQGPPLPKVLAPFLPFQGYWPWYKTSTAATLSGKVKSSTGEVISGAAVKVSTGESVSTDSSGNYKFNNLKTGIVTVTATATGYQTKSYTISLSAGANTRNIAMTPEGAEPPGPAYVSGVVSQGDYNYAVEGAAVTIGNQTATTDSRGRYAISNGITPGAVPVQVVADGFDTYSSQVVLVPGEITIDIFLSEKTASVSGYITDPDNQPLSDVLVKISGLEKLTDQNGFYQFTSMHLGPANWRISKDGYQPQTGTMTLVDGINSLDGVLSPVVTETYGPAFTFGAPYNSGIRPNPAGSGDQVPYFSVQIKNNGSTKARHLISTFCDYYNKQTGALVYDNLYITQEYVELAPGQSYEFKYDSYDEWVAHPEGVVVTVGTWSYAHFWIQDELGNASPTVNL
jgi:hypothetical protein